MNTDIYEEFMKSQATVSLDFQSMVTSAGSLYKPNAQYTEHEQAFMVERRRIQEEESTRLWNAARAAAAEEEAAAQVSLSTAVGQTITAIELIKDDGAWTDANIVKITLADNRTITLTGWGYDEWGITAEVSA